MKLSILHSTLLTLALALLSGCSKNDGNAAKTLADEPLPVRTLAATNAVFERATTVQGTLESVDSAVVSARIPGPLLRVRVDLGDKVKAGETVLFEVDPATVSNQVVIAREAAATARAQVSPSPRPTSPRPAPSRARRSATPNASPGCTPRAASRTTSASAPTPRAKPPRRTPPSPRPRCSSPASRFRRPRRSSRSRSASSPTRRFSRRATASSPPVSRSRARWSAPGRRS